MTVQTFHTLTCDDCGTRTKTRREGERPVGWGGPMRMHNSRYGEDYCPSCTRFRIAQDWPEGVPMPEIGQDIYIGTSLYIDHGEDDVQGGLAKITAIEYNPACSQPTNRVMVKVSEVSGHSYNYLLAMHEQDERRERYGDRRAYPDPDVDEHGVPNRY